MSMGMDTGWLRMFMQVYFESVVATLLPIWRVFKTDPTGLACPLRPKANGTQRGSK